MFYCIIAKWNNVAFMCLNKVWCLPRVVNMMFVNGREMFCNPEFYFAYSTAYVTQISFPALYDVNYMACITVNKGIDIIGFWCCINWENCRFFFSKFTDPKSAAIATEKSFYWQPCICFAPAREETRGSKLPRVTLRLGTTFTPLSSIFESLSS